MPWFDLTGCTGEGESAFGTWYGVDEVWIEVTSITNIKIRQKGSVRPFRTQFAGIYGLFYLNDAQRPIVTYYDKVDFLGYNPYAHLQVIPSGGEYAFWKLPLGLTIDLHIHGI